MKTMTQVKQPVDCIDAEIGAFCSFVRQGGEVEAEGLERRVRRSQALVFLYVEGVLASVAGLKRPTVAYRDRVFRQAQASEAASRFKLELGWVFVPPEHRRKGYSRVVASAAMTQTDGAPAFATTRADNTAMQRTLEHLGFARLGDSWTSNRGEQELVLYVTPPNQRLHPMAAGTDAERLRVSRRR
jgi:GNAT superfamily N-acetyltransferase